MLKNSKNSSLEGNVRFFAEKVCSVLNDMGGASYTIIRDSLAEGPLVIPNSMSLFIEFSGSIIGSYVLSLDIRTAAALVGIVTDSSAETECRGRREEFTEYLKEVLNAAVGQAIEELDTTFGELTFLPPTVVYGEIEFPRFMGASVAINGREGKILCGFHLNFAHLKIGEQLDDVFQQLRKKSIETREERQTTEAILELLPVGLMAINSEGIVLPGYSRATLAVSSLGTGISPVGTSLFEVLDAPEAYRREWNNWLLLVFSKYGVLPFDEITRLCVLAEFTSTTNKRLKLTWLPVEDKETDKLDKLLVVIEDLSRERELEQRMHLVDKRHRESLDMVASIVHLHPDELTEFLSDAVLLMENAQALITESGIAVEQVNELFRAFHTLKGNAGYYRFTPLQEIAHSVEEHLRVFRDDGVNVSPESICGIRELIETALSYITRIRSIRDKVERREEVLQEQYGGAESVFVPLSAIDVLLDEFDRFCAAESSDYGEKKITIRNRIARLRTVSLRNLVAEFQSLARITATKTGKKVRLVTGADIPIDVSIVRKVRHCLLHLINNAIDHGIELPPERSRIGKPETGTITLSGERTEEGICLCVADDGEGICLPSVRKRIQEKYGVSDENLCRMDESKLFRYLLNPGFSTKREVTDISGRGVGMDVVKTLVEEVQGTITITSSGGTGTAVILRLPANY